MSFPIRPLRKINRLKRDVDISEFCIASASNSAPGAIRNKTSDPEASQKKQGRDKKHWSQTRRQRTVQIKDIYTKMFRDGYS